MSDILETTLCGIQLKNPVIAASGTFGFGEEYAGLFDVGILGGISSKGLTLNGSYGNKGMSLGDPLGHAQQYRSAKPRRRQLCSA